MAYIESVGIRFFTQRKCSITKMLSEHLDDNQEIFRLGGRPSGR